MNRTSLVCESHFGIRLALLMTALGLLLSAGCSPTRNALPGELMEVAQPVGIPDVRAWGGRPSELFQRDFVESIRQVRSHSPTGLVDKSGWVNILALSGGGPDGAFGAGFLAGWTAKGERPSFKLVTGVSTGALIAPFAFLGPKYDETLKRFFTTTRTEDVIKPKPLIVALVGDDSLTDSSPLARLIEKTVTEEVIEEIARQHLRGRRLYILKTNLDARRAVVWNMGAIAASGKDGSLELFHRVMRASASIPVAMGPVYMPVEAGGKVYDEMHVDGGVTSEVFFYGFMLDLEAVARQAAVASEFKARIFIIRNSQLRVQHEQLEPRMLPIVSRAISSLIATQAIGDLYRIYTITQRDGIDFNLAYIPDSFVPAGEEMFDTKEMTRLYELGHQMAKKGYPWLKAPIGIAEAD